MPQPATDRQLLLGILALQNGFIDRNTLVAAFDFWVQDKTRSLGEILLERQALQAETLGLLQGLVAQHLKMHGDDAQQSLAAVGSAGSVPRGLEVIADLDVQASLVHVGGGQFRHDDPYATASMGGPTTAGLRFRILRPHAKGGLGEVFVARDEELHREVALKQIQERYADHPESRARFMQEAEITGGLEHPGIVPVYGLGQYADGRPFYAMRFIKGGSLLDAIQKYHLPRGTSASPAGDNLQLRQLLGRFIDVCNAIQYAHDRGVLHRDLKPGNVMLGKYGETLVVDWGLAKALGGPGASAFGARSETAVDEPALQPRTGTGNSATVAGSAVGTPQYMSPEQAAGRLDLLGPSSDIYSLGATLYHLLTGMVPFRDQDLGVVLGKVQRGDFPAPRQLKPRISPALEAVCLKAMARQVQDRYVSTRALAEDVERWLADEPVRAFPEPWSARLGRWARRNRTLVASAGVLLSVTVIGLAIFSVLLNQEKGRTDKARARAEANFKKAQDAVDQYLTKIGAERLLNEPGLQDLRRELLASAQTFYVDLARAQGDDPAGRLALGEAKLRLAQIHITLGERTEAFKVLEEARDLFVDLLAGDTAVDVYHYNLAQCYLDLAGQSLRLKGPVQQTEDLADKAHAELEDLVQRNPLPRYRHLLAETHNTLAKLLTLRRLAADGEAADRLHARAVTEQKAAVKIWEKLVDDQPDNPAWSQFLAAGLGNQAALCDPVQEANEMEQSFTSAAGLLEKLVANHPGNIDYQTRLGGAYRNLGLLYNGRGDPVKAEDNLRRAVAVREKLARKNPHVPDLQFNAAGDHFQLADFLFRQANGRTGADLKKLLTQARAGYQRSIAMYQRLAEDYPDEPRYLAAWGQSLNCMGDALYDENKAQAVPWYDQGIDKLESAFKLGEKTTQYARSLANAYEGRGLTRAQEGRFQPALADLDRAVELHVGDRRAEMIRERRRIRTLFVQDLLLKQGDFAGAAKELAKVTADQIAPKERFVAARYLAICADLAHAAKSPLADSYAAEVVVLLRQAKKEGYFNNAEEVKGLEELNQKVVPLSRRADFQELLRELKKK